MLLYIFVISAVLVAAFVLLRYLSVARGGRRRDEAILTELAAVIEPLERGESPAAEVVREAASAPQRRPLLHAVLVEHGAADLFPSELCSTAAQAEGLLAYWLMHPNEMQEAPVELASERVFERRIDGKSAEFHVLRFLMRDGHWGGKDWLLGVAGPFFEGEAPYQGAAGAFSRGGDKAGETDAVELLEWFIGMARGRTG